jgi:hypothetical protein
MLEASRPPVDPPLHVRLRIDHGQRQHAPQVPRAGNEYILEWAPAFKTLATLGLYVRPWILVDYWRARSRSAGSKGIFSTRSNGGPEYPNPAFDNMTPEDAFLGRAAGREVQQRERFAPWWRRRDTANQCASRAHYDHVESNAATRSCVRG